MFQMFFTQQKAFVIRQLFFFFFCFFFGGGGGGEEGGCCCLFSTVTTGFYTFSFASMDLRNIEKKQLCFLGITKFSLGGKVNPSVSHFDYLFCFKHLVITISLFIPRHESVARYYVIPFGVCPSVRPSVRPSVLTISDR